jgi:deferrochelatase/peroxidase EfeB
MRTSTRKSQTSWNWVSICWTPKTFIDESSNRFAKVSDFHFSATLGFGIGFFELLRIPQRNRPTRLHVMPDHTGLGDPTPYSLGQTDLIIQLGSSSDFVSRWVLENSIQLNEISTIQKASRLQLENLRTPDIVSAIAGWATILDINSGFQRVDTRNLQGFNVGVSNPRRLSPLFDRVVWTNLNDDNFKDGISEN